MIDISLVGLLVAAAGGFMGAVLGGLISFVFVGFMVLIGIAVAVAGGGGGFTDFVAWGPVFAPDVVFAGGLAAAGYAYKRGYTENGRDIGMPLVSLNKPDVLLVGAAFGVLGYLMTAAISVIPWLGHHIDPIAASIVIASIIIRLLFGTTGIIGPHAKGLTGMDKFRPSEDHFWLPWQQDWLHVGLLGLFIGALSGYASYELMHLFPEAAGQVMMLGFGISSVALLWLALGHPMPVTHHITLQSALAVLLISGRFPGLSPLAAVLIAAAIGAITALIGEVCSRLFTIRGDTHIDPPTVANLIVSFLLSIFLIPGM